VPEILSFILSPFGVWSPNLPMRAETAMLMAVSTRSSAQEVLELVIHDWPISRHS
jgi:hypothetical protein